MKFKFYLLLLLISCSCAKKTLYFDTQGKQLTKEDFQKQYRDSLNGLAYWEEENDTAIIESLHPEFEQYTVSYPGFLQKLHSITGKKFGDSSVVIISYEYKNDLCSKRNNNLWTKRRIEENKDYTDDIKANIALMNEKLIYLVVFEKGIRLENDPTAANEYYFSDEENFLRKNIFRNPTTCGSIALIRPPGEILVSHGEGRTDIVAARILPDQAWYRLFPPRE